MKFIKTFENWGEEENGANHAPKFNINDYVKVLGYFNYFIVLKQHIYGSSGWSYRVGLIDKDYNIIEGKDIANVRRNDKITNPIDEYIPQKELIEISKEEKAEIETGLTANKYNL